MKQYEIAVENQRLLQRISDIFTDDVRAPARPVRTPAAAHDAARARVRRNRRSGTG